MNTGATAINLSEQLKECQKHYRNCTEGIGWQVHPLIRLAESQHALLVKAEELLEKSLNGLQWYWGHDPSGKTSADMEMQEQLTETLAALHAAGIGGAQ